MRQKRLSDLLEAFLLHRTLSVDVMQSLHEPEVRIEDRNQFTQNVKMKIHT